MMKMDSEDFTVAIIPPASAFYPLEGRRYTLCELISTGELTLAIGNQKSYFSTSPPSQLLLTAEWITNLGEYRLDCHVFIDEEEENKHLAKVRFMIFQRELTRLLTALINGDKEIYTYNPLLLDASIHIQYHSSHENLKQSAVVGTPRYYLKTNSTIS
ncbi:staygreen family protein [Heyndrickxia acidicola]|uniref:Staygreen family protein n=1 Tax=Heyndrickxia acidicola TaxID=209389 RepID=A0ABU6MDF5_9BACI|nr:staygreen family protein [Heyndrickxia acidicola]MED1201703.1 staygreen family protein [Heyndrickxia acidicola]